MRPLPGRTGRPGRVGLWSDRPEDGMVTAELAMALPCLVLVVALLGAVVGGVSAVARASDAARSAARAASIGTGTEQVVASASRLAPSGSHIDLTTDNGWVTVVVRPPPVRIGPFAVPVPPVTGSAPLESAVVGLDP